MLSPTQALPRQTVHYFCPVLKGAVYPVEATVLTLTEKRVKIEADDEGDIMIRYVPAQSLQRQT